MTYSEEGYREAFNHYKEQKEQFFAQLRGAIEESKTNTLEDLNNLSINAQSQFQAVNDIISKINTIINNNSVNGLSQVQKFLSKAYQKGEMTKREVAQAINKKMTEIHGVDWISKVIIPQLGNIQNINDAALFGRVKMLLNMAVRHITAKDAGDTPLKPSEFTKGQLEGILYEHAVVDGLTQYFKEINLDQVVVSPQGDQGGRSDIKIEFSTDQFNKGVQGTTNVPSFNIQVKNTNLEEFLASKNHSAKLKVGGGAKLFKQEFQKEYSYPSVENSIYFLSKKDRVKRAIGEKISAYAYANGQIKFTADLIDVLHFQRRYVLGMPNISQGNMYIEWMQRFEKI